MGSTRSSAGSVRGLRGLRALVGATFLGFGLGFAAGFFAPESESESRARVVGTARGGSFKVPVVGRPANKLTGGAGSVVVTTGGTGSFVVPVVRPAATATGAGAGAAGSVVWAFVPVRLCERVLMIEVLVRAMVERFESKGVGGCIPVE